MINIGPWWIYDTIIVSIILVSTINGVFRNIWAILFFAVGEIIIAIISFFVAKIITDAIGNFIVGQMSSSSMFQGFANIIGDVTTQILGLMKLDTDTKGPQPQFSGKGFSDAFIAFILSSLITVACYLILVLIFNIVLIILYNTMIKNKYNANSIKLYARLLLGTIFGFITGLVLSYPIYLFASSPFVTNDSIDVASSAPKKSDVKNSFSIVNTDDAYKMYQLEASAEKAFSNYKQKPNLYDGLNADLKDGVQDIIDKFSTGTNSFNEYALSAKIYEIIHIDKSNLSKALNKYIYTPLKTLAEKTKDIKIDNDDLKNAIDNIEDLVVRGYASNNPKDLPITGWINLIPENSRPLIRLLLDVFLTLPQITDGNIRFAQNDASKSSGYGDAHLLDLSMKSYYIRHFYTGKYPDVDDELKTFKGFDEDQFIDWYHWAHNPNAVDKKNDPDPKDDEIDNQFLVAKNGIINNEKIGDIPKDNRNRYIVKVLEDPSLLWNFLKNLAYINHYNTRDGTLGFLPNAYTSLYLVRGMEVVDSGDYFKSVFGYAYPTEKGKKTRYDNKILSKYLNFLVDIQRDGE